jgi:hypothetical protein
MKAYSAEIQLDKANVTKRLIKALRSGVEGVAVSDIAAAEAGRPVRETALRKVYGSDELTKAFASDAITLAKSQGATGQELHPLMLVRDVFLEKSQRTLFAQGYLGKEEIELFVPDPSELRDRMFKALHEGDARVTATDLALLDTGRIREVVLKAVLAPDEHLAHLDEVLAPEPLNKSLDDALSAAGIDRDVAARHMKKGGRR